MCQVCVTFAPNGGEVGSSYPGCPPLLPRAPSLLLILNTTHTKTPQIQHFKPLLFGLGSLFLYYICAYNIRQARGSNPIFRPEMRTMHEDIIASLYPTEDKGGCFNVVDTGLDPGHHYSDLGLFPEKVNIYDSGVADICGNGVSFFAYFNDTMHGNLTEELEATRNKYCSSPNSKECEHNKAYAFQNHAESVFTRIRLEIFQLRIQHHTSISDHGFDYNKYKAMMACGEKLMEMMCDVLLPKCGSACFRKRICRRDYLEFKEICSVAALEEWGVHDGPKTFASFPEIVQLFSSLTINETDPIDPHYFQDECYEVNPGFEGSLDQCFNSSKAIRFREVHTGESGVYKNGARHRKRIPKDNPDNQFSWYSHTVEENRYAYSDLTTYHGDIKPLADDLLPGQDLLVPLNHLAPYLDSVGTDRARQVYGFEIARSLNKGVKQNVDERTRTLFNQMKLLQSTYNVQVYLTSGYAFLLRLSLSILLIVSPLYWLQQRGGSRTKDEDLSRRLSVNHKCAVVPRIFFVQTLSIAFVIRAIMAITEKISDKSSDEMAYRLNEVDYTSPRDPRHDPFAGISSPTGEEIEGFFLLKEIWGLGTLFLYMIAEGGISRPSYNDFTSKKSGEAAPEGESEDEGDEGGKFERNKSGLGTLPSIVMALFSLPSTLMRFIFRMPTAVWQKVRPKVLTVRSVLFSWALDIVMVERTLQHNKHYLSIWPKRGWMIVILHIYLALSGVALLAFIGSTCKGAWSGGGARKTRKQHLIW